MIKEHLNKRVKIIWFFPALALVAAIWLLGTIIQIFPGNQISLPIEYEIELTVIILVVTFAYVYYKYENYYYEFAEKELIIRKGTIEKKVDVIPYDRIQHIRTERTVMEILLGLVHVHLDTAGPLNLEDQTKIPGISARQHDELIERLNERIRLAKQRSQKVDEKIEALLTELIRETKTTNSKLDDLIKKDRTKPLL